MKDVWPEHVRGMTVESEWEAAGDGSGLESGLEEEAGCFLDFGIGQRSALIWGLYLSGPMDTFHIVSHAPPDSCKRAIAFHS